MVVNDTQHWTAQGSDNISIDPLLAVGLPSDINYGTVNATYVSDENTTIVMNYGNVRLNLSLSGYAVEEGDGYAMNCTYGNIQNISIYYQQYNLTASNPGAITLSEMDEKNYNLSSDATVRQFALGHNYNETDNDAENETYWRIYVPIGVAGSCTGNIVFGATQGPAA
jgi:hypothetical protein